MLAAHPLAQGVVHGDAFRVRDTVFVKGEPEVGKRGFTFADLGELRIEDALDMFESPGFERGPGQRD